MQVPHKSHRLAPGPTGPWQLLYWGFGGQLQKSTLLAAPPEALVAAGCHHVLAWGLTPEGHGRVFPTQQLCPPVCCSLVPNVLVLRGDGGACGIG